MSLDHAILGFLNREPLSGYDLKKAFDGSVRHFWPADQSQIYRNLSRLMEKGWVEVEVVPQEDRPPRKVYSITPQGREEFRRWMTTPLPPSDERSADLIQVFFAYVLSDEEALAMLRSSAAAIRAQIEVYESVLEKAEGEIQGKPLDRGWFFGLATLECGFASARGILTWIESVIERLENKDYTLRRF